MADELLGPIADAVEDALAELSERDAVARIWDRDHTLWQDDPDEIANRLGWLDCPEDTDQVSEFRDLAQDVAADGFTNVILAGMGGSSMFADVVAHTFPPSTLRLHVLDSTDPSAIRRVEQMSPTEELLFVVASKSGESIETRCHLAYFWEATGRRGEQFVAITDRGTPLADLARERGFRHLVENRPDLGGRYSALSGFGLVPAAFVGADLEGLLERARRQAEACGPSVNAHDNPAARLAAVLAAGVRNGRDKVTLLLPPEIETFSAWLEQLIAESTGKHGTGLLPVVDEPFTGVEPYGDDRLFVGVGEARGVEELADSGHPVVHIDFGDALDLGAEVFRWELAIAMTGVLLDVNPFDQPDVAAAKRATARVLRGGLPDLPEEPLDPLLKRVGPDSYVAILAYVDPGAPVITGLTQARLGIRDRLQVATSLGIGPRYLHSTGQLHKGGPKSGVFLQVVGDDLHDVPIPGLPHGFATLKHAQAAGDLETLRGRGLPAGRVAFDELVACATWVRA